MVRGSHYCGSIGTRSPKRSELTAAPWPSVLVGSFSSPEVLPHLRVGRFDRRKIRDGHLIARADSELHT
jgi:hypothetical protein